MANLTPEQGSFLWALKIMKTLRAAGVSHFMSSPGFRNSPLVLALLHLKEMDPHFCFLSHVDERGAAFFALGMAKISKAPVVVFCTSGTATANYFPAVLEAEQSAIPLIVVTADRPAELVGTGANQALDQKNLFGSHVQSFVDLPPAPAIEATLEWNHAEYSLAKAVTDATGPVHINCAFREPFLLQPQDRAIARDYVELLKPRHLFLASLGRPTNAQLSRAAMEWSRQPSVMVTVGPGDWSAADKAAFGKISKLPNTLVVAEASSGLGFATDSQVLLTSDALFKNTKLGLPQLVIRLGAPLTSRAYESFLARVESTATNYWIFDGKQMARNPTLGRASYWSGEVCEWLKELPALLRPIEADSQWRNAWIDSSNQVLAKIATQLENEKSLTELHIANAATKIDASNLFLGNSMPIRDFNTVAASRPQECNVFSNRGLSGIDGLISTALGIASTSAKPTLAVLGDLSTLHDLNALSLAKRLEKVISFQLWILNNGGGEIFRVVKTSAWPEYEEWFTTPQKLDFSALAQGFGLSFERIESQVQLEKMRTAGIKPGIKIVEFCVEAGPSGAFRKSFLP